MKKETETNDKPELPCPRINYEEGEYKKRPPNQETIDIWCGFYLQQEVNEGLWGNEVCHFDCERPILRGLAITEEDAEAVQAKRKPKGIRKLWGDLLTWVKGGRA